MTPAQSADYMTLYHRLKRALATQIDAHEKRDLDAEIQAVVESANAWAIARPEECVTITIEQARDLDRTAMGHVDWFNKLCLYITEAVYQPIIEGR